MTEKRDEPTNSFLDDAQSAAVYMPKLLEQQILVAGRSVLGIFTAPATLVLRRDFGTQAIHPITYCLGWLVLQIVTLLSFMIPSRGVIDIWALYLGFIALSLVHAARLRPMILNMDLEDDGEDEGRPWPFFNLLPFATQPVIRCLYEPLLVIVGPYVLYQLGIVTAQVAIHLAIVALCVSLRSTLRYYEIWTYARDMRNNAYRARMMHLLVEGKLTSTQVEALVFTATASEAVSISRATNQTVEPEFAKLKTKKQDAA